MAYVSRFWTINGRFLAQRRTGVQRYAYEIVRHLDELLAAGHPLTRGLRMELLVPPDATEPIDLNAIRVRETGWLRGHCWEQVVLPAKARGPLLNLCNTGPLAKSNQLVCIHDLNTRVCPESYSRAFRTLYGVLMPTLGRTARRIVTVSQYSADALVRHGICAREKIVVIPNGHEHALRWTPQHSAATHAAAGPDTIVLIGSTIPHKNVRLILGMAERLAQAGLRLAVVGARDRSVFGGVAEMGDAANIAWLGRLSDAELAALLSNSLCLAFPSLVEGFGLPPLEAMALGCPVVVSDRASLPEVCGEAALYAAPDSPDAWLGTFMRLRRSPTLRARMIARGRRRAGEFRWENAATIYLAEMARIDGVAYQRSMPALAACAN